MRGLRRKYSPFSWSKRTIRTVLTVFYMVAVPIFVYFGLQPVEATEQNIVAELEIPSINLNSPVVASELIDRELTVPDRIVGEYSMHENKTLLFGHSSTIFRTLKAVNLGDKISYGGKTYSIENIATKKKSYINMTEILETADRETIILMTCAGRPLGHDDYTHRLIVTATKV